MRRRPVSAEHAVDVRKVTRHFALAFDRCQQGSFLPASRFRAWAAGVEAAAGWGGGRAGEFAA
jgi:hypothetical protein